MSAQPSPEQLRAGRALLGLEQGLLAHNAGVSIATLRRVEAGTAPPATVRRVADALGRAGVRFIEHGVQLRDRSSALAKDRQRRIDELLALADAIPDIDPNFNEDSLYGDDGLPR